ncbi:nuclear transport factor 2 family protein [Burkholderia cepacia]|uniref:nuclear transport factor 2 family protein n=1 Tax=Burkholderia cepacia TaxID=292 RepID=UPI002AB75059|nr:nuclear transport factor 2 family protein [Burkholderia cepacia]
MSKIDNMFSAIDRKDVEGFVSHLADDVVFQFGNAPEMRGREVVAGAVTDFFGRIAGLRHVQTGNWEIDQHSICRFMTYYRRLDGNEVSAPCAVILHHENGGLIDDYRIYIDLAPVFAESTATAV